MGIELLVDGSFKDFRNDWDHRDGTVVGRIGRITGFDDWVYLLVNASRMQERRIG